MIFYVTGRLSPFAILRCLLAHHVRPADVDHSGLAANKLASVQNPVEVIDPGERG